jgi:hypothetical protein
MPIQVPDKMVAAAGFTEMEEVRLSLSVEEVREDNLLIILILLAPNNLGMELEEFRLEVREMTVEMVAGEDMHLIITLEEAEAEQEDTGESQQQQPCNHIKLLSVRGDKCHHHAMNILCLLTLLL